MVFRHQIKEKADASERQVVFFNANKSRQNFTRFLYNGWLMGVGDPIDKSQTNTKPSVLLVEDNLELADFLISSFTSEFNLIYKQNCQEALDYLAVHSADLIVSDVMMPKLNGFDFCQRVKRSKILSRLIKLTHKNYNLKTPNP